MIYKRRRVRRNPKLDAMTEMLDYAINEEKQGIEFYNHLANMNTDSARFYNTVNKIISDEELHLEVLRQLRKELN